MKEISLVYLRKSCESCPEQWEGITTDGKKFYARARHGRFRAELNEQEVLIDREGEPSSTAKMLLWANADLVEGF